jgi:hypothetical protein
MPKAKAVKTLSEFIDVVSGVQEKWSNDDGHDEYLYPWFRGQNSSQNPLLPGLYRMKNLPQYEFNWRNDFKQKALPFLSDTTFAHPSSNWDWYILMQHYGLPTRLLDWSEGSLIALYFALSYKRDDDESNPCVWMLNPFKLNELTLKRADVFIHSEEVLKLYVEGIDDGKLMPQYPAAVQPSFNSKRIVVQKGCFTVHGRDRTPLEQISGLDLHLKKIEISYEESELIKADLVLGGITETMLFPELGSLCKEILQYYT